MAFMFVENAMFSRYVAMAFFGGAGFAPLGAIWGSILLGSIIAEPAVANVVGMLTGILLSFLLSAGLSACALIYTDWALSENNPESPAHMTCSSLPFGPESPSILEVMPRPCPHCKHQELLYIGCQYCNFTGYD